jgi:hypothetical protein
MTDLEREMIVRLMDSINATNAALAGILAKVERLEAQQLMVSRAMHSIHSRLQLQEAGTSLYEMQNVERSLN